MISICSRSWSHRLSGKLSATPASILRKCVLMLSMATSAAFYWWQPCGTSSIDNLHVSWMCSFMFSETSLSRTCFVGVIPACFSSSVGHRMLVSFWRPFCFSWV